MTTRYFIDSNVIVYSMDTRSPAKQARAEDWIRVLATRQIGVLNLQALNEVRHVLLRNFPAIPETTVRDAVASLRELGETPLDWNDCEGAWMFRERFRFQWCDCLLLSAAVRLGCSHFLTEDFSPGVRGELTIVNPFVVSPDQAFATS